MFEKADEETQAFDDELILNFLVWFGAQNQCRQLRLEADILEQYNVAANKTELSQALATM